jgi:hypothetical protein
MAGSGVFPKTATLDIIYQADYNLIQSTIAGVLSTYYGQTTLSSQLSATPVIQAAEWDNLRQDINKCYRHITNANSTILDVDPEDIILAGDANAYKVAADYCETNKATVNAAQLTSNVDSDSLTVTWQGTRTFKMTYAWTSANAANAWFNLGGYLVVDISGANAVSSKDIDWRDNILNAMATQTYTRSNWVNGTNIDVYEYGNNAVYSENYARIVCTKVSSTQLDISVIVSDVDAGDVAALVGPGPAGPAVDENVDTDVAASITRYSSFDAIVAPSIIATPVTAFNSTTPVTVSLLVVGGGGAGGSGWPDNIGGGGGGGGGGGSTIVTTTLQAGLSYPVVVGAGGTNIPYPTSGQAGSGGNSSIAGYVGYGGTGGFPRGGGYDGSGGTGGIGSPDGTNYNTGGAAGGYNSPGGTSTAGGGGGGGGVDDANNDSGIGGAGSVWSIDGVTYGGGGGGGGDYARGAAGGAGGGGHGGSGNDPVTAGSPNTGGGGGGGSSTGGGSWGPGANGGKGIVIVSYVSGSQLFSGGDAINNSGGRWYHLFYNNGTLS